MSDWLREFVQRARAFFRREEMDRDFDEEMAAHLELATNENLKRGMSLEEAGRQALIRFGGTQQTKESHRDARALPGLDALLQDVSYGARMLGKNFSFTGVAVIALALGIGFSSIIFSIFYNGVLYPFPYRDAQRLTVIGIVDTQHNSERFREVYHLDEVAAFRKQAQTLEDVVAYGGWDTVYLYNGVPEQVHGCVMTPNATQFWGVAPLLGRGIDQQDAKAGASPVVLLGYAFWKSAFHGDKNVIGASMTLNGQARTIIGVMPRRFGLFGADFYAPVDWNRPEPANFEQAMDQNDPMYFFATAFVKRDVSRQQAAADLQVIAEQLLPTHRRDYPEHFAMTARPLNEVIVDDFKQTLFLLIAAVVLLLLISSSNVASLLLTHYTARSREIALRAALGASRARLIRQLFVESLLLGAIGCLFGCFLGYLGLLVVRLVPGVSVPGEADMSLNLPVLLFAVLLSLVTTLFFGLSPAFLAVKRDLRTNLQTSGVNVNAVSGGARIRAGLVVGQVALSMLLLVFAGLMIRSFLAVTNYNTGMRTQGLLHAFIHLPPHHYESPESKRALYDQLSARVATLPGVTHTAFSIGLPPIGGPRSDDVTILGKPHDKHWTTAVDAVNDSFFPTIGLQLLHGQLFSADDVSGARRVAVVNTALVKSFFGDDDPLGRQIKFNVFDEEPDLPHDAWFQIVGVVNDLKGFDPKEAVLPQAYMPRTCLSLPDRRLLVRSVTNPSLLLNPIRQIIAGIDPDIVVVQPSTLEDELQRHVYMKPKFRLVSFGTCAGIGLGLALIGLFGVMAYSVTLQTHELGVRMALGAQSGNILTLVLRKGFLLVGCGIFLGFVTSFLAVRIVQSQLWGVSAFDPWTLTLAPIALMATGLLACYVPAKRATRVDPMVALRYE
jgi:putative ABC transport system permease protein